MRICHSLISRDFAKGVDISSFYYKYKLRVIEYEFFHGGDI